MFPANMLPLDVRAWPPAIMLLTGLCGILLVGYIAAGEDRHVKAKEKVVKKDGKIDYNDEEETQPDKVELIAGGKILIISKTFLPPKNGWKFKKFKKSTTHVDIWANPGSVTLDRPKDTAVEIKIRGAFPVVSKSAASFPLRGEGNLTPPSRPGGSGGSGGTGGKSKGWHWSAKVADVKVDLDICNGQGGAEVPEDKEESVGAFTVANLNDTDGDGKVDNVDDEVKATAKGRDEVDLMKLILRKPYPDTGGNVTLRVVSGKVKFWRDSTKQKEFKKKEKKDEDKDKEWEWDKEWEFPMKSLPPAIWVEATEVSKSVRDIKIEMSYKGSKDTVRATGVWVEFVEALHDRSDKLWKDIGTPTRKAINAYGGKVGLVIPSDTNGLRNFIAFKYRALPVGVGTSATNTMFVKFDNARQVECKLWHKTGTTVKIPITRSFPTTDDAINDDLYDDGETNVPDGKGHLFAADAPGFRSLFAFGDLIMWRLNFRESFRVRFDGTKPSGGTGDKPKIDGSRCSPKFDWYVRHTWKNVASKWERTTGDVKETDENDIGKGHITIGRAYASKFFLGGPVRTFSR